MPGSMRPLLGSIAENAICAPDTGLSLASRTVATSWLVLLFEPTALAEIEVGLGDSEILAGIRDTRLTRVLVDSAAPVSGVTTALSVVWPAADERSVTLASPPALVTAVAIEVPVCTKVPRVVESVTVLPTTAAPALAEPDRDAVVGVDVERSRRRSAR